MATFGDVTKCMREREASNVANHEKKGKITVTPSHLLDKTTYNVPLTLKTYVSPSWKPATITQAKNVTKANVEIDAKGAYLLYQANPNGSAVTLTQL